MQTAVITGASAGIGRATATELGRRGFHILVMGRSEERAVATVAAIHDEGGSAEWARIDLASLDDVRRAARVVEDKGRSIDVLVNNAGVGMTKGQTSDGFEVNFGVNHLGHYLLTHLLGETFRPGTRIVNVTSSMHFRVDDIDFDRLTRPSRSILGIDDYSVSKLANVLFTRELARREPEWRTYAVHPGFIDTGILKWWVKPFIGHQLKSPEVGARTIVLCATEPGLADESGRYYARMEALPPSLAAQDEGLADELWDRSERWCEVGQAG